MGLMKKRMDRAIEDAAVLTCMLDERNTTIARLEIEADAKKGFFDRRVKELETKLGSREQYIRSLENTVVERNAALKIFEDEFEAAVEARVEEIVADRISQTELSCKKALVQAEITADGYRKKILELSREIETLWDMIERKQNREN